MPAHAFRVLVLLGLLAGLLVAGCGDDSSEEPASKPAGGGSQQSASADKAVADLVPAEFKNRTLTVAADATYPPNEFVGKDGKTVEGMDPDLAKALAGVMGVKVKVVNATFDAIIPGLASGKYDIGMSSFTDTKEREQTVDFVTYFSAGTSFYTKADGGTTVQTLDDLCGKKVAVEKGTTQHTDAQAQSKKCEDAGKPAVDVQTYPDQNGANLALSSGRAQVGMADSPVAAYLVKQSDGQFEVVGEPYGTAPYGIALPKDSGLAEPVQAALKKLIDDGTYKQILDKWGIAAGAIAQPEINGATS